jgi:hypothetical protein
MDDFVESNEVAVRVHPQQLGWQSEDRLLFIPIKSRTVGQLVKERPEVSLHSTRLFGEVKV